MGGEIDFSREKIKVTMDNSKIAKPLSAAAKAYIDDFSKKVVEYDTKNFPSTNQNTFCW